VRAWRVAAPPWAACAPRLAPGCSLRGGYSALFQALLSAIGVSGSVPGIEAPPTPSAAAAAHILARSGTHSLKFA
jgi:hypothetical protein